MCVFFPAYEWWFVNDSFQKCGIPQNGWFISWKLRFQWVMTGGTPTSGNLHVFGIVQLQCLVMFRDFIWNSVPGFHDMRKSQQRLTRAQPALVCEKNGHTNFAVRPRDLQQKLWDVIRFYWRKKTHLILLQGTDFPQFQTSVLILTKVSINPRWVMIMCYMCFRCNPICDPADKKFCGDICTSASRLTSHPKLMWR